MEEQALAAAAAAASAAAAATAAAGRNVCKKRADRAYARAAVTTGVININPLPRRTLTHQINNKNNTGERTRADVGIH